MEKSAEKNVLFLVFAGAVLVLANMAVVMGVRNGQIAPVDNITLWGAFAVLNICSLLWAVSLLGLQPMVVAVSYVAGGLLAFQGIRMTPDVNVAEIATAGATYSAFGALLVGNATAKVRMIFFAKRQVPFVFIIMTLLVIDGLLNSRISSPDWHIISMAVLYPFLFSGVVVGLTWMLITRVIKEKPIFRGKAEESLDEQMDVAAEADGDESAQLVFSVPESAVEEELEEMKEPAAVSEPVLEEEPAEITPLETAAAEVDAAEDEGAMLDTFFPLEIDSNDDAPLEENPELLGLAAMVAEHAPEPAETLDADPLDEEPVQTADVAEEAVEKEPDAEEPVDDSDAADLEEGKAETGDWLSGHLDLLSKLK